MSPLELFSDELEMLVERAAPSVVAIEHRRGHGTGLAVHADGFVLTNAHVVHPERSRGMQVRFHDGAKFEGEIVGRDEVVRTSDPPPGSCQQLRGWLVVLRAVTWHS